ncbi:uncharacterized protein [Amphiura filiformis]|uniref:uncharacterized protein n=1 Tax=Amphiura filiformis TaxID=82378 RepID=UPI003B21DCCF
MTTVRVKAHTQTLVELYKESSLLWDTTNPDYFNRQKRHQALCYISEAMGLSVQDIKKKIHSFRTTYSRQKSALAALQQATPLEQIKSTYYLFDHLDEFLADHVNARNKMKLKKNVKSTKTGDNCAEPVGFGECSNQSDNCSIDSGNHGYSNDEDEADTNPEVCMETCPQLDAHGAGEDEAEQSSQSDSECEVHDQLDKMDAEYMNKVASQIKEEHQNETDKFTETTQLPTQARFQPKVNELEPGQSSPNQNAATALTHMAHTNELMSNVQTSHALLQPVTSSKTENRQYPPNLSPEIPIDLSIIPPAADHDHLQHIRMITDEIEHTSYRLITTKPPFSPHVHTLSNATQPNSLNSRKLPPHKSSNTFPRRPRSQGDMMPGPCRPISAQNNTHFPTVPRNSSPYPASLDRLMIDQPVNLENNESAVFGQLVALEWRKIKGHRARHTVKMKIQELLYAAQHEHTSEESPLRVTQSSSSTSSSRCMASSLAVCHSASQHHCTADCWHMK